MNILFATILFICILFTALSKPVNAGKCFGLNCFKRGASRSQNDDHHPAGGPQASPGRVSNVDQSDDDIIEGIRQLHLLHGNPSPTAESDYVVYQPYPPGYDSDHPPPLLARKADKPAQPLPLAYDPDRPPPLPPRNHAKPAQPLPRESDPDRPPPLPPRNHAKHARHRRRTAEASV